MVQRESNMHRFEGHHFTLPFAPISCAGKHRIHIGDPLELREGGAKVTQNGYHNVVHV